MSRRCLLIAGTIVLSLVGFRVVTGKCPIGCALAKLHGQSQTAAPLPVTN